MKLSWRPDPHTAIQEIKPTNLSNLLIFNIGFKTKLNFKSSITVRRYEFIPLSCHHRFYPSRIRCVNSRSCDLFSCLIVGNGNPQKLCIAVQSAELKRKIHENCPNGAVLMIYMRGKAPVVDAPSRQAQSYLKEVRKRALVVPPPVFVWLILFPVAFLTK